ncbi:MAG: hypothetical protein HXS46_12020 [Theionarchaea archaeon]|nr:MAG: hypothetical protein AYK18_00175 [Theionarchaea archaeon DG-70]MBU7011406.1 hypothetical protein [Theionarchaea archaeon]
MDIMSIIDSIVNAFKQAFYFVIDNLQYVVLILVAIIAYAVASHVFFRMKGYQPSGKSVCILTVMGKERSLDYLRSFTHMSPQQIETIRYLRKNESAPFNALCKRYGKENVEVLIRKDYITLT